MLKRLAAAQGYVVFDREGKRVGAFIELADAGKQIAIREDGVLVWRRRVLPLAVVRDVIPARAAVVLNVDKSAVKTSAPELNTPVGSAESDEQETRHALIAHYASTEAGDMHRAERSRDRQPTEEATAEKRVVDRHLLFVSTPDGYQLLEREGPAPDASDYVSLPEHQRLYRVVKLAESPLPNDRTVCAYLEGAE
jgi:hypothetical protein